MPGNGIMILVPDRCLGHNISHYILCYSRWQYAPYRRVVPPDEAPSVERDKFCFFVFLINH